MKVVSLFDCGFGRIKGNYLVEVVIFLKAYIVWHITKGENITIILIIILIAIFLVFLKGCDKNQIDDIVKYNDILRYNCFKKVK